MRVRKEIQVGQVKIDRLPLDKKTYAYAKDLENGAVFPAIKVAKCNNGTYEIRDGRHRWVAHKLTGRQFILAKFSTKELLKQL